MLSKSKNYSVTTLSEKTNYNPQDNAAKLKGNAVIGNLLDPKNIKLTKGNAFGGSLNNQSVLDKDQEGQFERDDTEQIYGTMNGMT
jgi:hypothetical protein